MPTASSIQFVTDANGTAHAFLEDDGFLWQCQWNSEAQRWDKGQVVPMAYGGEKLQALLVEDLFPTGGSTGDQQGNTPGIVLAYRVGKGSEAQIYASFGQWGSDGELQWKAPLALTASAVAKDDFDLLAGGDGTFRLVVQQREAQADLAAVVDALNNTPTADLQLRLEEALSGARSDSDLSISSFRIGSSGSTLEVNLQPSNPSGNWLSAGTITAAEAIQPATQPPLALGGNTQLDRAQLAQSGTGSASGGSLSGTALAGAPSAAAPGSTDSNWSWKQRGGSTSGQVFTVQGLPVGETIKTWEIPIGKGWPRSGAATAPNSNQSSTSLLPGGSKDGDDISGEESRIIAIKNSNEEAKLIEDGTSVKSDATSQAILKNSVEKGSESSENGLAEESSLNGFSDDRKTTLALLGQFGTTTTSSTWTSFSQSKFGLILDTTNQSSLKYKNFKDINGLSKDDEPVLHKKYNWILGGAISTYYYLAGSPKLAVTGIDSKFSGGFGFEWSITKATPAANIYSYSAVLQGGYSNFIKLDLSSSPAVGESPLLLAAALLPTAVSATAAPFSIFYGAYKKTPKNLNENTQLIPANEGKRYTIPNIALGSIGLLTSAFPQAWDTFFSSAQSSQDWVNSRGGLVNGNIEGNFLYDGIAGFYAALSAQLSGFSNGVGFNEWAGFSAGVALPLGSQIPLIKLYQQHPAVSEQANPGTASRREASATAQDGAAYPFSYAPASGSQLFGNPGAASNAPLAAGAVPLIGSTSALQRFDLAGASASSTPAIRLAQAGSGLTDGSYSNVPILALSLPGSAPATLSFTVSGGAVVDNSITITVPSGGGAYLGLPETEADSGIYVLTPDVFSTNILPDPGSAAGELNLLQRLPLITLDSSQSGAPLTLTPISAVLPAIPLSEASDPSSGSYPERDPATGLWAVPATGDNTAYTYVGVPVSLSAAAGAPTPSPLNPGVTASVRLSAGRILAVTLDQPLYLAQTPASFQGWISGTTLQVQDLSGSLAVGDVLSGPGLLNGTTITAIGPVQANGSRSYTVNLTQSAGSSSAPLGWTAQPPLSLTLGLSDYYAANGYSGSGSNPSYGVSSEALVLNNLVEDEAFLANPVASSSSAAAAVWLSAGVNDQLAAFPQLAGWPVQNRVAVSDAAGAITYLNATSANGTPTTVARGNDSLAQLSATPVSFSAASTPTAITISGSGQRFSGASLVFWVEASDPVIPAVSSDGSENYQAFMQALYGAQRINYRINVPTSSGAQTGWETPNLADLYTPDNAVIRHLQAFEVMADGQKQTLLVWDETPITGIKDLPSITLSGWIDGTSLSVSSLSGPLKVGDLIGGSGVAEGTVITAILSAFDGSSGTYAVSRSQSLGSAASPLALNATDLRPATVLKAGFLNPDASSLQWNALFKDAQGQSTIQTIPWDASQSPGLGLENLSAATQLQRAPDGSLVETPVLSWNQGVRTPYREAVLNSQPFIYLDLGALAPGLNSINLGGASPDTTGTFASSSGLNFAIRGALPKATASAVQNLDGTGVLATGTGSLYGPLSGLINNATPEQLAALGPAQLQGSLSGTTLTVTSLSGNLSVGELLSGAGVIPGTVITAVGTVDADGLGSYTVSQAQELASTSLLALPVAGGLPYASFSGSLNGTSLTVSQLSGSLQVGDQVVGEGILAGTTITAIGVVDASGNGSYTLNQSQIAGSSAAPLALVGTPAGSAPYTVEFWTQLGAGSNANGAGLVAFGQPSAAAVGAATAPSGWLLVNSFVVEPITYGQALQRGWISDAGSNALSALYGWGWAMVADGANTTAMGGNGGSNLYSNALQLNNLVSGQSLDGVFTFLANYGLTPADLGGGIDGILADTIAKAPLTQLQFNNALDPDTGLPVSNLNGIAIDTSSALLNQGVLLAGDLQSSARQQQLTAMFEQLWAYQQQTGEAKVTFSLAPDSSASTTSPTAQTSEQYVGYELGFSLFNGVAVSVDGQGRLVFDVAPGVSLSSSGTGSVPADLRDGSWHYVVASFLPDLRRFTISGDTVQLPSNVGTASLVIDNQLVANASGVINPFALLNLNDNALLLANNVGGAIDQVAFYDQALTLAPLPAGGDGSWPQLSAGDARQLLQELGFSGGQSPATGSEAGAITDHWLARNVNPNDALLATSIASFLPSADNPLQGSWTQAAPLNAALAPQATPASASAGSLQSDLVVAIQPTTAWGPGNNCWFVNGASQASSFNPGGQTLQGITVTLTPADGSAAVIRQLSPQEVLLGSNAVAVLQPRAQQSDFDYTFLSNAPALNLLISIEPSGSSDSNKLRPALTYTATVALTFSDGPGSTTIIQNDSSALSLTLNAAGSGLLTDYRTDTDNNSTLTRRSQALATAEVIEAAPLQLQYIDSGVVLNSASSTAAAGSPAAPSPARSFGASQVIGSFPESSATSNGTTTTVNQGWIAIAQPFSTNAISNPAGRIWVQYTGQSTTTTTSTSSTTQPSTTATLAPSTWLNALARSNFSPQAANQPLRNDANTPAAYGGLLIQADATAGWGQNFGDTMLVADVNNDGTPDLIIGAPQANGGGRVVIISGAWIQANLTNSGGQTVLNLANPDSLGPYVTILTGGAAGSDGAAATDSANFGAALAFDSTNKTLWIGAPNYQQTAPDQSEVPVGALYHYSYSSGDGIWGTGEATALLDPALGILGSTTSPDPTGASVTEYWGAQLGSAIAVANDGTGRIAVSAPGVQASLLYSGTEAVQQAANGRKNPSDPYGQGALVKIQLPQQTTVANTVVWAVSSTAGTANSQLRDVVNQSISPKSTQAAEESTYMQNLKALQSDHIADATPYNNQAIQTAAVGAVYLFNKASDLSGLSGSVNANSVATSANQGASFYGAQSWNTLQASGFGSSLTFANLSKLPNGDSLVIGASASGGPGAVYALDPQWTFSDPTAPSSPTWLKQQTTLGNNQYLAHLASSLTLYGAASGDQFGSGLVNLGDTNGDTFEDLLIQAFNADSGAGNGTVLFGSDQLINTTNTAGGFQPDQAATGSVAAGRIGNFQRADGSSFSSAILSELGSGAGATGQGTFGPGDVNGDGLNDIPLGAGGNGQAYLTYGQDYLEAISNLQLQKLASDNGYLLDGLATTTQGSLRAIGDFNGDGYGDFFSIQPGTFTDTVRIELGANTEEILADYPYNFYSFQVAPGTQVLPGGDLNGDGYSDIALFLQQNLSTAAEGNAGAGSTTGILYGRPSDQLPLGSGFGLLAPVDASSAPLAPLPTGPISGALSTQAPAMLAVGTTIYAVWCDETGNGNLWFAQSRDGGNSWSSLTNLTGAVPTLASTSTPSLALYDDSLYLAFRNDTGQLTLSSWDPASGTPGLWNTPTVLSSDGSSSFTSTLRPQLISSAGGLAITWVAADGHLASTLSTSPDTTIWSRVDAADGGGSSPFNPAMASDASGTVYMARVGLNNLLYWTSSSDGGQSWAGWQQLPVGMTSQDAPSLAVVNGSLYLTYLGKGNQELNITKLTDAASNSWTTQTVISNQTARTGLGAVAISETVGTTEGLAIYYAANNTTGSILRTWSATPLSASAWSSSMKLGNLSTNPNGFTSSSPLAVTRFQGNTVLAYLGDATTTNTTAYIATAGSSPNSASEWQTIGTWNTGNSLGIGLSSDATGVLLNTSDTGTGEQAIVRLTPPPASGSWSQSVDTSRTTVSSGARTATLLALPFPGAPAELLLAVADPSNGGSVLTSNRALVDNWLPQQTLQEQIDTNPPILATAAPSATLLNGTPVLAVNNNGTLTLYASNGGTTFSLVSSFNPGSANLAGSTAAGITTTDTGLALTYRNGDGSLSLQRLNLLNLDGTPVEGVVINADGSLDTSNADLQWQGITLAAADGLSTDLATVPLSVNGTLLLGSISNDSGSPNQVRLNAVPVLSDPGSTTWLNSTVQLPDGQGGWTLQQQAGGSSLSAMGDITGDGNADLLVAAAAVRAGGSGSFTGLRLISGGATSSQILAANDATSSSQSVQVAASFGSGFSTPVASLNGTVDGVPQLTLSATDTTSGQPSSLSTGFNLGGFRATAGDLASTQTLFSGAAAPVAEGTGLGLGFGDLSLITAGSFGDLNADGYLDSLEGTPTTVYGANGLGWHVWSIRAAGDVNGNGYDDILLSLVPPETVLNGAPQWIHPVLVDGALFEVDQATNSFSLNRMRRALNPEGVLQQEDLNSTSSTQPWPLLQNWLEPILAYEHPATNTSGAIDFSLSTTPTQGANPFPGYVVSSVSGDDGFIYLMSNQNDADSSSVQISKYDPNTNTILWTSDPIVSSASGLAVLLGQNSAALYEGRLYFAVIVGTTPTLFSIDIRSLNLDPSTAPSPQSWDSTPIDVPVVYDIAPSLVNEGDRLGLYYASEYESKYLNLSYAYSQPTGAAESVAWTAGTNANGLIKALNGDDTKATPYVQLNNGTNPGNRPSTMNVVATRFQGSTYVAYCSNSTAGNTFSVWVLERPDNPEDGTSWNSSNVIQANPETLFLSANETQLALTTWNNKSNNTSSLHIFEAAGIGNASPSNSLINPTATSLSTFSPDSLSGTAMVGSRLTLLRQGGQAQTMATPWSSTTQKSLAGTSIDGNIDTNGDGFMDMLVSDPSDPSLNVDNQYVLFGGDYLNIASQVGTPGDDVMLGTPLADVIYSIQGADQVSSNGGKDVIVTGAGDDAISIQDNAFIRIDAGSGFDALLLEGLANQSYDFRLNVPKPEYFAGTKLRDIELISSIDYGANLLSFDAAAINAINSDRVLFLTPDASDSIALTAEFIRNASFDTSFSGALWSAYAAAPASATPASGNPALIYVRTPDGQTADWLDSQVSTQLPSAVTAADPFALGGAAGDAGLFSSNAKAAGPGPGGAAAAVAADQPILPLTSPIAASTDFGDGLTLVAHRTAPASGLARFSLQRADSRRRQVIAYASSSANSSAEPGRDYTAVAGLVVLEPGQASQEITVPIDSAAFALLRGGSLSLQVEELGDQGQLPLHLLIAPAPAADLAPASVTTAEAAAVGSAAPPVLSGFELVTSADGTGASLRFRADSNGGTQALDQLQLSVSRRASATSTAAEAAQTVSLLDAMVSNAEPPPAYDAVAGALALDHDQRQNGQISAQLELGFTASGGEAPVRLMGPALQWQSPLQLSGDRSFQLTQDMPLTLWRADSGSGAVSFGLEGGGQTFTLLPDALGGSSGSISPQNALEGDPLRGWRSTEGLAVGTRAVVEGLPTDGSAWTPTASRDGQQLALLGLSQEGNQITASFAGGVTAVFGLQSTGSAPTTTPIRPAVEVQRLAGYDNSLGFYALDDPLSGRIDGLNPGEAGYLQKALARAEASGLLLSAEDLPGFGEAQRYSDLALDPNRSYGALLLVDGDRSRILSSFAEANPGGAAQVISLGTAGTGLVLGFEDQAVTGGDSDGDYNDLVVNITNVSVPLF